MSDVPNEVTQAALSAFEGRHAGADVLRLTSDSRGSNGTRHPDASFVLSFGPPPDEVVLTVTPTGSHLRLGVVVERAEQDLVIALEQLAPTLRLVREARSPALFSGVPHGFVCVTGTTGRATVWCTAWTHL